MNWTKVTKQSDIKLDGVTVEIDQADTYVKSITIRDGNGKLLSQLLPVRAV